MASFCKNHTDYITAGVYDCNCLSLPGIYNNLKKVTKALK